jgi:hypothetical protein
MALFYLSIPFMLLGVAVAVVPLIWAIHHDNSGDFTAVTPVIANPEMVAQHQEAS